MSKERIYMKVETAVFVKLKCTEALQLLQLAKVSDRANRIAIKLWHREERGEFV